MLLPFVLQSAEVMKASVRLLEPFMERSDEAGGPRVLLATVRGDVHDIGKNLVDIILSNNGYRVVNLGTNVPTETIIEQAREQEVDAIGLSGLLVKSAIAMQESLPVFEEAGLRQPVLLGGAALTPRFVAESCAASHPSPVVYCADAFAGLRAVQDLERGALRSTVHAPSGPGRPEAEQRGDGELSRDNPVPEPPFRGLRHVTDIDPRSLKRHINREALFRGRWGFKRGKSAADEYRELIEREATPILEDLERRAVEDGLVAPAVAYGYFPCHAQDDCLFVEHGDRSHRFEFPRQPAPPGLCIADYFKTEREGGDVVALFVVTVGQAVIDEARRLYEGDSYRDYLMLHGFAVELTEALAEHWHRRIRDELGCGGARYAFGYPACPDLEAQRTVFDLLDPAAIGISLTETAQLVPELSTSAIVAHHPQARYFAV
jgi:5-methyltetrahydrofolate--homocysteine methyltransferase